MVFLSLSLLLNKPSHHYHWIPLPRAIFVCITCIDPALRKSIFPYSILTVAPGARRSPILAVDFDRPSFRWLIAPHFPSADAVIWLSVPLLFSRPHLRTGAHWACTLCA